jgi:hypothetical protein
MRRRGAYIERSFAHLYDTGGMRRTHLRGDQNILKRLLIHAGGFNLGLVVRSVLGVGTPRGLQGRVAAVITALVVLLATVRAWVSDMCAGSGDHPRRRSLGSPTNLGVCLSANTTSTSGC